MARTQPLAFGAHTGRRYGSFAGRGEAPPGSHPVGQLTTAYAFGAHTGRRYGGFAGRGAAAAAEGAGHHRRGVALQIDGRLRIFETEPEALAWLRAQQPHREARAARIGKRVARRLLRSGGASALQAAQWRPARVEAGASSAILELLAWQQQLLQDRFHAALLAAQMRDDDEALLAILMAAI